MLATLTSAVPYIFRSLVQSLADLNHETFSIGSTVTQKSFTLTPLYENLLDVVYSTMTYGVGHGVDPSSGSLIQCVFTKLSFTMPLTCAFTTLPRMATHGYIWQIEHFVFYQFFPP